MTLHQLLNACNAKPEIKITVYTWASFEYEGKYEDLDPIYYSRKVNYFVVDKLDDLGYRIDIDHMKIYLEREGC